MSNPLDELAKRLQGDQHKDNLYFVYVGLDCVMATTSFPAALNLYESALRNGRKCSLQDRRQGLVASYDPSTHYAYDDTGTDYYQQQKWGWTDEQLAWAKQERDKALAASREYARVDKVNHWIMCPGKNIDSYFYVRCRFPDGTLDGYQVHVETKVASHRRRPRVIRVGEMQIDPSNYHHWKPAYTETVRALKLEDYL